MHYNGVLHAFIAMLYLLFCHTHEHKPTERIQFNTLLNIIVLKCRNDFPLLVTCGIYDNSLLVHVGLIHGILELEVTEETWHYKYTCTEFVHVASLL